MPFDLAVAFVNAGVGLDRYSDIRFAPDPYCTAVFTNHNFALPPGWVPSDLVSIGGNHLLREAAAAHFVLMRDAMESEGLIVYVAHSFRSYYEQSYLFNRAVTLHGRASAERQFARPGHSEHNAGLAVDILHREPAGPLSTMNFQNSGEFQWLSQNAHQFGFILRYPEAYTHIHGFIFEPWHWRFVGIEIATAMHDSGINTFEEFFGRYLVR